MTAMMLAPAFISLLGMGAFGSPIVAFLGEVAAKTKSRVFYDKYGQQTASMGGILLMVLLVVEAILIGTLFAKYPQQIEEFKTQIALFNPVLISGITFLVLGLPYLLLWKKMRNAKGLHMTLGFGTLLSVVAMMGLGIPAKLNFSLSGQESNPEILSIVLPMTVMYTLFIMVVAGAMSCGWLVLRRNKDDFGRDYYNFALKTAARWSFIPMIGTLVCQGWMFTALPETMKTLVTGTPLGLVWAVGAGVGLICAILWLLIARSESPLQLKGLTFLNIILLWLMHTANVVLFVNFMVM